jgi:hypothetical protein
MVIGTVTITRRARYPIQGDDRRDQVTFIGGNATVRVRDLDENETNLVTYRLRGISKTDFDNLRAYYRNTAEYSKNSFSVTDDLNENFTARFWGRGAIKWSCRQGRLYDVDVTFRKE